MRFFKENSYSIVKLFVNQIGISIFSLMLYTAVTVANLDFDVTKLIKFMISIFSILFYAFLLYTISWEIGAKDRLHVDSGKEKKRPWKGAVLSLLANLPNFLFASVCLILILLYLSTGGEGFLSASGIVNLIFRLLASMYLGTVTFFFDLSASGGAPDYLILVRQSILFLVLPLISILATHIGYRMGLAQLRLFKDPKAKK